MPGQGQPPERKPLPKTLYGNFLLPNNAHGTSDPQSIPQTASQTTSGNAAQASSAPKKPASTLIPRVLSQKPPPPKTGNKHGVKKSSGTFGAAKSSVPEAVTNKDANASVPGAVKNNEANASAQEPAKKCPAESSVPEAGKELTGTASAENASAQEPVKKGLDYWTNKRNADVPQETWSQRTKRQKKEWKAQEKAAKEKRERGWEHEVPDWHAAFVMDTSKRIMPHYMGDAGKELREDDCNRFRARIGVPLKAASNSHPSSSASSRTPSFPLPAELTTSSGTSASPGAAADYASVHPPAAVMADAATGEDAFERRRRMTQNINGTYVPPAPVEDMDMDLDEDVVETIEAVVGTIEHMDVDNEVRATYSPLPPPGYVLSSALEDVSAPAAEDVLAPAPEDVPHPLAQEFPTPPSQELVVNEEDIRAVMRDADVPRVDAIKALKENPHVREAIIAAQAAHPEDVPPPPPEDVPPPPPPPLDMSSPPSNGQAVNEENIEDVMIICRERGRGVSRGMAVKALRETNNIRGAIKAIMYDAPQDVLPPPPEDAPPPPPPDVPPPPPPAPTLALPSILSRFNDAPRSSIISGGPSRIAAPAVPEKKPIEAPKEPAKPANAKKGKGPKGPKGKKDKKEPDEPAGFKSAKGLKMLEKFGYKEGQGLGPEGLGNLTSMTALRGPDPEKRQIVRTYIPGKKSAAALAKEAEDEAKYGLLSAVVRVVNVANKKDVVGFKLRNGIDISDWCEEYGRIAQIKFASELDLKSMSVPVFIKFTSETSAINAIAGINGATCTLDTYFNGFEMGSKYYPLEKFDDDILE